MTSHKQSVQSQFDPRAEAYLESPVHANGPDLASAVQQIKKLARTDLIILDAGCGAGHLSFALSPCATRVDALDPSDNMLKTVQAAARQKGLGNIRTIQSSVESIPVPDHHYDVVATRYSAHHWRDLDAALRDMIRVLKPDGVLLIMDIQTWEDPLIDTHLQTIEILRDRSHVRNRSDHEWRRHLGKYGFTVIHHETHPVRIEFSSWIKRMDTPELNASMIKSFQDQAPEEVKAAMKIERDGSFTMHVGVWIANFV